MTWRPELVVVGATHYESRDQLRADHASFRVDGLVEWMREGHKSPWLFPPESQGWVEPRPKRTRRRSRVRERWHRQARHRRIRHVVRARALADRRRGFEVDVATATIDGSHVRFAIDVKRHLSHMEGERTELDPNIGVTAPGFLSYDEWERRWIKPINNFLIFVAQRPVAFESWKFADRGQLYGRGRFEVFRARWPERTARAGRGAQFQLVTRRSAGRDFGRLLTQWLRLEKQLELTHEVFIGTIVGRQWVQNQLLNMMSFAEGYHERLHDRPFGDADSFRRERARFLDSLKEPLRGTFEQRLAHAERLPQRQRLKDLVERACWAVPAFEPLAAKLVRELVATRNHVTHHGQPGREVLLDDRDQFLAVERLAAIMYTNMLLDLGIDWAAVEYAIHVRYWKSPVLFPEDDIEMPS